MASENFTVAPPDGPPPFLSEDQLLHLAQQGWVSVTLPSSLSQAVTTAWQGSAEFFSTDDKDKSSWYPAKQGTEFGYYHIPAEKEYITYRCRIHTASPQSSQSPPPPTLSNLEDKVADAWRETGLLLFRILCDFARASDLDLSVWDDILDGTLTMPQTEDQITYTLMRLFRYLPATGYAEEHTDLGLLTLCVGDGEGLQVLDWMGSSSEQKSWKDAPIGAHTGTILVGQTLRILSQGMLNAGVHRVVENPRGRQSLVFALRHSPRHGVDLSLFGGQGHLNPKELWRRIYSGKVNINTPLETRESARGKLRRSIGSG